MTRPPRPTPDTASNSAQRAPRRSRLRAIQTATELSDIAITDPAANAGEGQITVLYGKATSTAINASGALDGRLGHRFDGEIAGIGLGEALTAGGSVAGRIADDLVVSAPGASNNGRSGSGSVYVLPSEEIPSCASGVELEEGDYATCFYGDPVVTVTDEDGRVSVQRAPNTNRKREGDTEVKGVPRGPFGWFVRRTGVTIRVTNGRPVPIGEVAISGELRLTGGSGGRFFAGIRYRSGNAITPGVHIYCWRVRQHQKRLCPLGSDISQNATGPVRFFEIREGSLRGVGRTIAHESPSRWRWEFRHHALIGPGIYVDWATPLLTTPKIRCVSSGACRMLRSHAL